jgi:hypothetical protein
MTKALRFASACFGWAEGHVYMGAEFPTNEHAEGKALENFRKVHSR